MLVADGSVPAELLVCPSSPDTAATGKTPADYAADVAKGGHQSYVYIGKGLTMTPPRKLLAYEPLSHHEGAGSNVLYSDGSVQFLNKAAAIGDVPQLAPATQPATAPTAGMP